MDKCGVEHRFDVNLCERCGEMFCAMCCTRDEHSDKLYCPACGYEVTLKETHKLRSFTERV